MTGERTYTWQDDIRYMQAGVKPAKDARGDEAVAVTLYQIQMGVFSAYAGHDLDRDFGTLPKKVREQWIEKARSLRTSAATAK